MTPRRRRSRIYWRHQGGTRRAYGDFRDYRDVGGGREALRPEGSAIATVDLAIAETLVAARVKALEAKRRGRVLELDLPSAAFGVFVQEHLIAKAKAGRTSRQWLERSEFYLDRASTFFGAARELHTIAVRDVERWLEHLRALQGKQGLPLRGGTVLHHLHALSNLFRRAQKLQLVPLGHNPVWALMEKPERDREEARWLEVPDAALLLEAAKRYQPPKLGRPLPFAYPLLATFLLTGGRMDEVLGLEVADVSFERKTVQFHATPFRRGKKGKSRGADRIVPLWPQLEEVLGEYLVTRPLGQLLFPVWVRGAGGTLIERRVADFRGTLEAIATLAGVTGKLTSKMFRHTYCLARLQTLDRGEPVSLDTVRRELGHATDWLVRAVYGHLGSVRHRAAAVEFRAAQHREALGERWVALQRYAIVTGSDTDQGTGVSLPTEQAS